MPGRQTAVIVPEPNSGPPPQLHAYALQALGGPPLGVAQRHRYTEHRARLDQHGALIAFTDGLIERRDQAIDDSLTALLAGLTRLPATIIAEPESLATAILALVPAQRTDDTALLVLATAPSPPSQEI